MFIVLMKQCDDGRPVLMTNQDLRNHYPEGEDNWAAMFKTREEAEKAARSNILCRGNGYVIWEWYLCKTKEGA